MEKSNDENIVKKKLNKQSDTLGLLTLYILPAGYILQAKYKSSSLLNLWTRTFCYTPSLFINCILSYLSSARCHTKQPQNSVTQFLFPHSFLPDSSGLCSLQAGVPVSWETLIYMMSGDHTCDRTSSDQLSPMEMGSVGLVGILLSFSDGRSRVGPKTVARLWSDILLAISFSATLGETREGS